MSTLRTIGSVCLVVTVMLLMAAQFPINSANANAPGPGCATPTITTAQPVDGGTLKVSRIAGAHAGISDQWDMRYDAWFCNPNATDYNVTAVKIEHLNGAKVTTSVTPTISATKVPAGSSNTLVMVRDDTQYDFPLPTSIRLKFTLTKPGGGTLTTLTQTHPVAENLNPGPLHAYFYPARQADLPSGAYWFQGRHAESNTFQRWAYDLKVQQWNGSAWINDDPNKDVNDKDASLTFNHPVYAMSDGLVIGCNRGAPDNKPKEKLGNVPGGNLLWVRTGNETTLYAHLKQNSILFGLCPFNDDKEHKVGDPTADLPSNAKSQIRAGQLIARTGNSGFSRSGGSHLHIHSFLGLPAIWGGSETGIDADARPLEFVNVRVQEIAAGNVDSPSWNLLNSRKLLPYNTRIEVNGCSFDPSSVAGKKEVVNLAVPGNCFLEMVNAMVQAGNLPVYIDVHGTGSSSNSSTAWRPADGTAALLFAGLDAARLKAAREKWVNDNGYRILQLEAYVEGGQLKHAVIFVKGPSGGVQFAQAGMTEQVLQNVADAKKAEGFVPVNISGAEVGGVPMYDALFEKKNIGSVISRAKLPIASYQAEFEAQKKAGRHLVYIDGYELGNKTLVSAIWYSNVSADYAAMHGGTKAQVSAAEAHNLGAGKMMRGITEYKEGGVLRYAGLWR
jgi:hypothetical protein